MKQRYWLSRFITALWAGTTAYVTLDNPDSLAARALEQSGALGAAFLYGLLIVAALAIVDSACNDLADDSSMPWLREWRHVGFSAMAIVLLLLGTVVAIGTRSSLCLVFLLPALCAALITWLDLWARCEVRKRTSCPS